MMICLNPSLKNKILFPNLSENKQRDIRVLNLKKEAPVSRSLFQLFFLF